MQTVYIRETSFAELFTDPAFDLMAAAYASESGTAEYGEHCVDKDGYYALEADGDASLLVAESCDCIVGFAVICRGVHLHYSKGVAVLETLFLDPAFRRGGLGIKLIRAAQKLAKDKGFEFMTASAPVGSRRNKLYARMGLATDVDYLFKLGD